MHTFSTRFFEPMQSDVINPTDAWKWQPENPNVKHIYGSGHKTSTRSSTYAAERDNESDFDRPNEGA